MRAEELEMAKMKMQARLSEAQGTIEQLNAKMGQLDRAKGKLQGEIEEVAVQADQAHILNAAMEKKAMNKMETRIRELESELDAENRRLADASKNLRKSERRIKELAFAGDEDRKNHERMQALIDQLQGRIKTFKKQIEEAEEIAAMN